jgi:hypothetical protein
MKDRFFKNPKKVIQEIELTQLRGYLLDGIQKYLKKDNIENSAGGELGRNRACIYFEMIHSPEFKTQNALLDKVVHDFLASEAKNDLGSSVKLRRRIGEGICGFLKIDEAAINDYVANSIQAQLRAGGRHKNLVLDREVERVKARAFLIKEAYAKGQTRPRHPIELVSIDRRPGRAKGL